MMLKFRVRRMPHSWFFSKCEIVHIDIAHFPQNFTNTRTPPTLSHDPPTYLRCFFFIYIYFANLEARLMHICGLSWDCLLLQVQGMGVLVWVCLSYAFHWNDILLRMWRDRKRVTGTMHKNEFGLVSSEPLMLTRKCALTVLVNDKDNCVMSQYVDAQHAHRCG